jgi:uncharacterized repeat protein (TIGR02543 family)
VAVEGRGTASANLASAVKDTAVTLTATPEPGQLFKGWRVDTPSSLKVTDHTFTMPDEAVGITAVFQAPSYKVIYNGNGAASGLAPADGGSYEEGVTVSVYGNTGALNKPGYNFAGWNMQADGSGAGYTAGQTFTMGGKDMVLYAQWTVSNSGGSPGEDPVQEEPSSESPPPAPKDEVVKPGNSTGQPATPPASKPGVSFRDLAAHWAESDIKQAVDLGIVSGYPDGTFKPDVAVTRAEFAVMLMQALQPQEKLSISGPLPFTDLEQIGDWARNAVAQAVQAGIISGYEDGSFRPDARINRSEMAKMIANALDLEDKSAENTAFADDKAIPDWAKGAAAALSKRGIMAGREGNQFAPGGQATRAEAVKALLNMLRNI